MSKWIRKGDFVTVIAGNDKGKTGEVLARYENRVVVQGVNVRKKHLRSTEQTQGKGRVVDMEVAIHISNVALCDKDGVRLKVKVQPGPDGVRQLVSCGTQAQQPYRSVKKPA